jgi:hypothetical protein
MMRTISASSVTLSRRCEPDPQSMTPTVLAHLKPWGQDQIQANKTVKKFQKIPVLTTMGISFEQPITYPQPERKSQSCSFMTAAHTRVLLTGLNSRQVLDQKGENGSIHR